jgi:hypothetical protein
LHLAWPLLAEHGASGPRVAPPWESEQSGDRRHDGRLVRNEGDDGARGRKVPELAGEFSLAQRVIRLLVARHSKLAASYLAVVTIAAVLM